MHLDDLEIARRNMVLQQIRPWDVFDERVLSAIQTIPREKFVPEAYLGLAFADIEVPIGHGQAMMAPRVEARMLQSLDVEPQHSVLEIGTGSGFVTACLARLGGQVISIDLYEEFIAAARKRLEAVGLGATTQLRTTDAFSESFDNQQFDRIAVTGSLPDYDKRFEQLLTHVRRHRPSPGHGGNPGDSRRRKRLAPRRPVRDRTDEPRACPPTRAVRVLTQTRDLTARDKVQLNGVPENSCR